LQGKKTALGRIWLPHDARAKTFAAKRSAVEIFIDYFGSDHVSITPQSRISDRVNAARVLTPKVEFHETNCAIGLEGLRAWSYEYDEERKIFSSDPLHDWASHEGDGYSYGCLIMQQVAPPKTEHKPIRGVMVGTPSVTLDEMWATTPKQSSRI
jgi:phage terminase large subunit